MVIPVDGRKYLYTATVVHSSMHCVSKVLLVRACSVKFLPTLFMQERNKQLAKTMKEFDLPRESKEHENDGLNIKSPWHSMLYT